MRLDRDRWAARKRHALDDVGIERALSQELSPANLRGLGLEYLDEVLADGLALGLGIGDARQRIEELLLGVHVHERNVVVIAEQAHHLLGFAKAHQAVIDEHAGELIADGLVDQHGGDGAVDAA